MIRIDEIYHNIFWAWIQEQNNFHVRILYCYPHGSSAIKNIIIKETTHKYNHIYNGLSQEYIYFHDQEPIHMDIHTDLFNYIKDKNNDIFQKSKLTQYIYPRPMLRQEYLRILYYKTHTWICDDIPPEKAKSIGKIVVSEKNSSHVDHIIDEYGWQPHYYFFHGWASLDWYRGYHRSFLISHAKYRTPTKTFISPNRIIGGKRDHRVLFLYHIFKNNLNDNYITSPKICPEENVHITEIAKKYINVYPDIIDTFNNAQLPQLFKNEKTQLMTSCWITNHNESADSLFYVPTETVYFGKRWHLTEKTFKPIVLEMPFILVAPAGSLEYLRSYGFKTFSHIIDESYDKETDDILRLEKIAKLLTDIDKLSTKEKQQIHNHCLPIVEHNYNHFYFGNFEGILWKELTGMMQEWL